MAARLSVTGYPPPAEISRYSTYNGKSSRFAAVGDRFGVIQHIPSDSTPMGRASPDLKPGGPEQIIGGAGCDVA
jgi:hypothetical protein